MTHLLLTFYLSLGLSMAREFLKSALEYQKMGLSVIPILPKQKKAAVEWRDYQQRCATKEEIVEWWHEHPDYNIGIVTGKVSKTTVVDLDKYKPDFDPNLEMQFFDNIVTPTVETPNGGNHLWLNYIEGLTIGSNVLPAIDIRGDGGYIVAPPSVNGNGKPYKWIVPLSNTMSDAPTDFLTKLKNSMFKEEIYNNNKSTLYMGDVTTPVTRMSQVSHPVTFSLESGTRDDSLFHVANTMTKGGASPETILKVLELLAKQCNPPFPENELLAKCKSAIDRARRKERNIAKEVLDFVSVTTGYFSVTDVYQMSQAVTKEDKHAVRMALSRLNNKVIEKHGHRDGIYKRIETELEFVNFEEDEEDEYEYPISLPLGLSDVSRVCQGNIILVAGEFNAGKTTFVLNVLKENMNKIPIRYIFSEGGKSELRMRFNTFDMPKDFFTSSKTTEFVRKSADFHAAIRPDALNIIDYMEFVEGDHTQGAEYLRLINDKLKTGVAIIAIQKKQGALLPRSGDLVMEKPRLVIAFTKIISNDEYPQGACEILKCKIPRDGKADGKKMRYEIRDNGSRFSVLNSWGYWKKF